MNRQQLLSQWQVWWNRPYFQYLLLAGITLVALILRFYKLGEWSFWFDEIFTVNRATVHYNDLGYVIRRLPQQVWLPVSVLLTGQSLTLFGVSEFNARLFPAIIGIITIPILYFPIRRYLGTGVALISCLLLAVSPWHLFWSQNARFYTALLLFTVLALSSFYYAFERDKAAYIFLGFGLLYLAGSERLTAFLVLPAFVTYLLLLAILPLKKPAGFKKRNLLLFFVPAIAFVFVELFLFLTTGTSFFWDVVEVFGVNRGPSPLRLVYRIILDMGVPITCLAVVGGLFLLSQRTRIGLFLVSFATIPVALLVGLNPFMFTDDRYAFMVLPAWIMLAAVTLKEIFTRISLSNYGFLFVVVVPLLLVSTEIFTDMRYFQSNKGHRLDWQSAFSLVESRQEVGDVTVSYWPELADYYLKEQTVQMLTLQPSDVIESDHRNWFIIDDYAIWSASHISLWVEQACELVMSDQLLLERPQLLRVYLCDPTRIKV